MKIRSEKTKMLPKWVEMLCSNSYFFVYECSTVTFSGEDESVICHENVICLLYGLWHVKKSRTSVN